MFSRGKATLTCTVCRTQYETTTPINTRELVGRGWNVSNGAITCKQHSDLHWPTRRRVSSKSAQSRLEALR